MDKTEHKEIPFPDSGKMWVRYSKELAKSLCDYLTSQGEVWDSLELKRYGVIRLPCTIENKIDILQNIHIERTRYVCETIVTIPFAEEEKLPIEHRVETANELNAKLKQGEFLVDRDSGGILFVTTYEPDDRATPEQLAEFVEYPKRTISKYGDLLLKSGGKANE